MPKTQIWQYCEVWYDKKMNIKFIILDIFLVSLNRDTLLSTAAM